MSQPPVSQSSKQQTNKLINQKIHKTTYLLNVWSCYIKTAYTIPRKRKKNKGNINTVELVIMLHQDSRHTGVHMHAHSHTHTEKTGKINKTEYDWMNEGDFESMIRLWCCSSMPIVLSKNKKNEEEKSLVHSVSKSNSLRTGRSSGFS